MEAESNKSKKSLDFSKYYPLIFTIVFVVILFQYSFSSLEAIFYDLRVKYDIGISYRDNIVVITMDEESDQFLGENFPYTYATHSRMVKRLLKDKPAIINYIVNLQEPDSERGMKWLGDLSDQIGNFTKEGGAFRFGTSMDVWGEQLPPKGLRDFGYSMSLINQDNSVFSKDDVTRRALLNISGFESLHLWTANQYRKRRGEEEIDAQTINGSYYVRESDATFTLYRYYTNPEEDKGRIKKIPFHRVMVGNFPKGFFTDKIVLIGHSYISNASDYVLTPYNTEDYRASKLFIHAEIIQSLIQNKTVVQIPRKVSNFLAILIAIVLSIVISRIRPTAGLGITLLMMVGIILVAYLLFCLFGLWLYVTHLILTVFVVYYIWVPFRAIGEYQRRYAIQEETKLLKKVENLKQNFISLMSHDLKTPVAKIAGMADVVLRKYGSEEDINKNLNSIIDSTKELNNFITSILDLTKIESRDVTLNLVSKDINQVVTTIVDSLKYEAANKEITVETELAPLYPIQFDLNLLKRVLSNLIENAIKYSGERTTVSVKTWDDESWVYVEIKDNGVGIPEEDLENIFEKFYRVKNDASHTIKGSGLGLYLVKYFVDLHGGDISAESAFGEGTTFLIKLKNE